MRSFSLHLFILYWIVTFLYSCKENSFLVEHWKHPLPLLNDKNEGNQNILSTSESNLDPKQCSTCHETQWNSWKNSFHAKSIGNGLVWQKEILTAKEFNNCLNCHSPLAETKIEVSQTLRTSQILLSQNQHFPDGVKNPSIQCASCHIRNQIWYGPPPRSNEAREINNNSMPHNGFQAKADFESSLFCKSCHESPDSGIRLSGKHLMEVYKEWKQSSFSKEGIQCQNCHMPNRDHSWKGIHDKEFVQNSIQHQWQIKRTSNQSLHIHAELKNIGVGHYFPTYLIPKINLRFYTIDRFGKRNLIEESIIGRLVNTKLTEEYYDTRIPPNDRHIVEFDIPLNGEIINSIVWETDVDPDEHYVRSFEESLQERSGFLSPEATNQLKLSLLEKRESRYRLFTLSLPVPVLPQQ